MNERVVRIGLLVLMIVFAGSQAQAQVRSVHLGEEEGWQFMLAPYIWMTGLDGDVTVGGNTSSVNADFGDMLDSIEGAAFVNFQARNGKWGYYIDGTYMNVASSGTIDPNASIGVDVDFSTTLFEVGAIYRVHEGFVGAEGHPEATDIFFGGRFSYLEVDLDYSTGSKTQAYNHWLDPIVGATYKRNMTDTFIISASGDIGGAGVGADLTWSLELLGGWQLNPHANLWLGYRYMSIDYDDGIGAAEKFIYDVTMHGPIVGASFYF